MLMGFMIFAVPSAFAADTAPPQLLNWSRPPISVSIIQADAVLTSKFVISDDSEIVTPRTFLRSLSTGQVTALAVVKEVGRSGKLVSYEATATIKVGQSPRYWEWVMYPLQDSVGNLGNTPGPTLGSEDSVSTQRTIVIFDKTYTNEMHREFQSCTWWVKHFNWFLPRVYEAFKLYPGDQNLEALKLIYTIPTSLIDEKSCESNPGKLNYDVESEKFIKFADDFGRALEKTTLIAKEKADAVLKIKQEADAKVAAELKAKQEVEAKAAATKKTTIACVKGKQIKKVTSVKPVCPSGFKKR